MKIYITRHGQTNLNKKHLMQGRTDEPLNEHGKEQAGRIKKCLEDVHFDVVFASPLDRAIETASIISGANRDDIIIDERIIETDFGRYEKCHYLLQGPKMSAYWAVPELFGAPESVESIPSMIKRSRSFLRDIEKMDYDNVLIVCHGGIIRALCGYLEDKKSGIRWRPKPKNCEVRVYDVTEGKHTFIKSVRSK